MCCMQHVKYNLPNLAFDEKNPLRGLIEKAGAELASDILSLTENMSPMGQRLGTKTQWALLSATAPGLKSGELELPDVLAVANHLLAKVRQ